MITRRLLFNWGAKCSIATPPRLGSIRLITRSVGRPISTTPFLHDDVELQPPKKTKSTKPQPSSSPSKSDPQQPISSCPQGTILKGINYIKKLSDPVALPDDQYPSWLWTVIDYRRPRIDDTEHGLSAQDQAALYGKSKKKRQAALKKMAAMGDEGVERVTPDHQTSDMVHDDPFKAQEMRRLANKYAKTRRKASIKERNFLDVL